MKVLVVWERVIASDFRAPSAAVTALIPDARATQWWDPTRILSKHMGEQAGERDTIVWDHVAIYPPGELWDNVPPTDVYHGRPVVAVADEFRERLHAAVESSRRGAGQ